MFYSEKGIALFLTIIVLGATLGMVLGVSSLILRQIMTVSGLGESVSAMHAADSGIERLIYEIEKNEYSFSCSPLPCEVTDIVWDDFEMSDLGYNVYLQEESPDLIIRSIGQYRQTRRAIEVTF